MIGRRRGGFGRSVLAVFGTLLLTAGTVRATDPVVLELQKKLEQQQKRIDALETLLDRLKAQPDLVAPGPVAAPAASEKDVAALVGEYLEGEAEKKKKAEEVKKKAETSA